MAIIFKPSPNYESGRYQYQLIAIVIHIMEGTLNDTDSRFAEPTSKLSAHYGVGQNGDIQ